MFNKKKQPIQSNHWNNAYILCMVIPTKVDASQVSQQNVNKILTLNTQKSKPDIQKIICTITTDH